MNALLPVTEYQNSLPELLPPYLSQLPNTCTVQISFARLGTGSNQRQLTSSRPDSCPFEELISQPATFRIYVDTPSEYATVPMLWRSVSLIFAYIDLSRDPIYM